VGSLVGTGREVSLESRAVDGKLTDEPVGAAQGIVGSEFQRDLSVVCDVDLHEIAIVLIKLMCPRDVGAKDNLTWNFERVRPAGERAGLRFKYMDTATTLAA
jgi:hypothetical protein